MSRIYCKLTECYWNREHRTIKNNDTNRKGRWNYKSVCSKNYIHLSRNGICLDFRGEG